MFLGFKTFVMRGNVIDLAVAVVIGSAFANVIGAFVTFVLTPLIAALVGKPDFSAIALNIGATRIAVGDFLNALVAFLLIALAVYLTMVAPMNAYQERRRRGEPTPDPTTKKCPECVSEIPIAARRCAFCTSPVG